MKSPYQDKFNLWHDKPTRNGLPSSNNWMVYTAISQALGFNVNRSDIVPYFIECLDTNKQGIHINRHPRKEVPPISRDEIIGAVALKLIDYDKLKTNHFVFHGIGKPMDSKTFKEILVGLAQLGVLVMLKGRHHRNMFWEKKVKNLYQLAFRLTPADVYWIKKLNGIKPHKEECLLWNLYKKYTLDNGSAGEKNILFVQAVAMNDRGLARKCKPEVNIVNYFGKDHDFSKKVMAN